jgi:protein arginine N-methyltransferase 5
MVSLAQALQKVPAANVGCIYLVEKNKSCRFNLQNMVEKHKLVQLYASKIRILCKDVRKIELPEIDSSKFDLVISEMIGSFGCNEMAPEIMTSFDQ